MANRGEAKAQSNPNMLPVVVDGRPDHDQNARALDNDVDGLAADIAEAYTYHLHPKSAKQSQSSPSPAPPVRDQRTLSLLGAEVRRGIHYIGTFGLGGLSLNSALPLSSTSFGTDASAAIQT